VVAERDFPIPAHRRLRPKGAQPMHWLFPIIGISSIVLVNVFRTF
jgi:hypothetical protein